MRDDSAATLLQSFLQGALVNGSGMARDVRPLFDVVQPAFPLPTTASPTLQSATKNGLGAAVVACDVTKPCKFPFLDSCQKRFLTIVKRHKLRWYGHVSRSSGVSKPILRGRVKERNRRRQSGQTKRREDNIKEWTDPEFAESRKEAENREIIYFDVICGAPMTLAVKG